LIIVNREEHPYPTKILKIGPEMVEVTAISIHPILVKYQVVTICPRRSPKDNIIKEIIA
jgi:hypothetical protein